MRAKIITDQSKIDEIINGCEICNLSMVDENNLPYVVPMNFGYQNGIIYFHSHYEGKKIDILEKKPTVAVSFSTDHKLYHQNKNVACSYGMAYKSVFAFGDVVFIDDYEEKIIALNMLMKNYISEKFTYNKPSVINIKVFKLEVRTFTCKEFGNF